jgi:hypothetical protein
LALADGELLDELLLDELLLELLAAVVEELELLHAAAPSKTHATASSAEIRDVIPRT